MVGQRLTVLAVGAGGDCSDIFFSRLSFLFLFFSPSLWNEWMGNLWFPFQQNFSDIRTLGG